LRHENTLYSITLLCYNFTWYQYNISKGGYKMAYVISDECIACGACIAECPVDAIAEGEPYTIDADTCIDCGACASACPVEAPKAE
jgi:NAD-dependent dihydropyrimidine dehydrogenase PreA subunit